MGLAKWLRWKVEAIGIPRAIQLRVPKEYHGGRRCGWMICPTGLGPESVVYSLGIGHDVSFDTSLGARYGLRIHGFDPTPAVSAWFQAQERPPYLTLHPVGIADYDGLGRFTPDPNPKEVSHTMLPREGPGEALELPVIRLRTAMERLGHERIDLLKMDVEGAEYGIIEQIVRGPIPVRQLLVEFHHRFPGIGKARTVEAIRKLNERGYRIFHVSETGREFSFLRDEA
jgi:FkbM family methyltransferase